MKELLKVDDAWLASNARVGTETILPEDLPIPRLIAVQKSPNKSILRDGTMAAPGTFYYAATKESSPNFACSLLSVHLKEQPTFDDPEEMEKVWNFIGAREGDWKPFLFSCRGAAAGAARSFVGNIVASGIPMFSFKTVLELSSREIKVEGKNVFYYQLVFTDLGMRTDDAEIAMLYNLAQKFGGTDIKGVEVSNEKKEDTAGINPDDVPF